MTNPPSTVPDGATADSGVSPFRITNAVLAFQTGKAITAASTTAPGLSDPGGRMAWVVMLSEDVDRALSPYAIQALAGRPRRRREGRTQ